MREDKTSSPPPGPVSPQWGSSSNSGTSLFPPHHVNTLKADYTKLHVCRWRMAPWLSYHQLYVVCNAFHNGPGGSQAEMHWFLRCWSSDPICVITSASWRPWYVMFLWREMEDRRALFLFHLFLQCCLFLVLLMKDFHWNPLLPPILFFMWFKSGWFILQRHTLVKISIGRRREVVPFFRAAEMQIREMQRAAGLKDNKVLWILTSE